MFRHRRTRKKSEDDDGSSFHPRVDFGPEMRAVGFLVLLAGTIASYGCLCLPVQWTQIIQYGARGHLYIFHKLGPLKGTHGRDDRSMQRLIDLAREEERRPNKLINQLLPLHE
jgi:hypothetical protein